MSDLVILEENIGSVTVELIVSGHFLIAVFDAGTLGLEIHA